MKSKTKTGLLLICGASLLLNGCAAAVVGGATAVGTGIAVGTDSRGGGEVMSDQELSSRAKDIAKAINPAGSYSFSAYSGKILLVGQVPTEDDKTKIYNAVQSIPSQKGVWNYLTVEKNQSFGQVTKDSYITSSAKTTLIGQSGVNANNMKVVTCNGVVYLMGENVGKSYDVEAAVKNISKSSDVKKVVTLFN